MLQSLLSQHDSPLLSFFDRLLGDIWQRHSNLQGGFSRDSVSGCLCCNDFLRLDTGGIDNPYVTGQSGIVQTLLQHDRVWYLICTVNQPLDNFAIGYKGQLKNRVGRVGITEWNPIWVFVHHETLSIPICFQIKLSKFQEEEKLSCFAKDRWSNWLS